MYNFDSYEIEKQVLEFMRQLDAYPLKSDRLILDGELHRYTIEGDKPSQKNGAYRIFTDGVPAGFVQDWKKGTKANWTFNTQGIPKETLDSFKSKEFIKEAEKRKTEREKALKEKQARASDLARTMFEQLDTPPAKFPYLLKKKVSFHNLRFNSSSKSLAVPLYNSDEKFLTLQWIDANGQKEFYPDAPSKGAFWSVNLFAVPLYHVILLGEGWATMAKVYELTGLPCVAAMNCNNLEEVAKDLQTKFPNAKIIVTADDDKETEQKRGFNPGIREAKKLVEQKLAVAYVSPPFLNPSDGSDWDDYAIKYGDEEAAATLKRDISWHCMNEEEKIEFKKRNKIRELISFLDPSIQIAPQEFVASMFPRRFVSAIVAPSGTGKTMFMQKTVSDLSVGGSIFDGFAEDEPPRKCLIFAGEAGYDLLIRRGAQTKWPVNPSNLPVIDQYEFESNDITVMLDDDEGWKNTLRIIDITKPDIVFWDTFTSFHEKDENKATDMKPIIKRITDSARNSNYAAVLVHHSRKRTAKERSLSLNQDDVIGSSVFNRLVALIVGIEPLNNDSANTGEQPPLLVRPLKTWFSAFMPFTYKISEDTNGRTIIQTDLAPASVGSSKIAVWNYVRRTFKPDEWFTISQIVLTDIEGTPPVWQVRRILSSFAKDKKLRKRGATKALEYSVIGFYDLQKEE